MEATDGVPEAFLPSDGHEAMPVRRPYRTGERVAWISVALLTHQDEPLRRPSVQHIFPETHLALIESRGRLSTRRSPTPSASEGGS